MATPVSPIPVAIDYTSRDYYSIRAALIERIKERVGIAWTGEDPADFGVALVEAFSYMGDITNYYIDRIANEAFIATATQRQSILNLANLYGYTPSGFVPASASVSIGNTSGGSITLPSGTVFVAEFLVDDVTQEVYFTLEDPITIADDASGSATVYNYVTTTKETLGISNGLPEQTFLINDPQVADGSIKVFINSGISGSSDLEWTYVPRLIDSGPNSTVFTTVTDANNYQYIVFGDGISGAIPPTSWTVKATYNVTAGLLGNVGSGLITELYTVPGKTPGEVSSLNSGLTINNGSPAQGGENPETNFSIRENAPRALSSLNRAVTLEDYANLSFSVANVAKAKAVASTPTSVVVYISPTIGSNSTDQFPGYTASPLSSGVPTDRLVTLQASVKEYLESRCQIGTTVTVLPPTYVPVAASLKFSVAPQYDATDVAASIKESIISTFSYNFMVFKDLIHPEELEYKILNVPGVIAVQVDELYRVGQTAARTSLIGESNEIFVFTDAGLTVEEWSSESRLNDTSGLTASTGTFSPAFDNDFYNYSLTVSSGTTSVNLTPTVQDAGSTLYVNGALKASGSSTSISTSSSTTNVTILVVAEDRVTKSQYNIQIVKS